MDKRQLASWRAETASKSAEAKQEDPASFTGRPYFASTETYAFKFRSFDPNAARWTSEDSSGFPDGANGSFYAPTPTSDIDYAGLWRIKLTSSGDGLTIYGGGPGTYTYTDTDGPLRTHGSIDITGAQGDIKDTWNFLTISEASYTGLATKQAIAMYRVSVSSDGNLYFSNATGTVNVGNDLNASSSADITGEQTQKLSLSLQSGAFYQATGISGFNIDVQGYGGGLTWTTADRKVVGIVPTLTFEAVE